MSKHYSVWLENHDWSLNNNPLSLAEAIDLFDEYDDDGYDDVYVWDDKNELEIEVKK